MPVSEGRQDRKTFLFGRPGKKPRVRRNAAEGRKPLNLVGSVDIVISISVFSLSDQMADDFIVPGGSIAEQCNGGASTAMCIRNAISRWPKLQQGNSCCSRTNDAGPMSILPRGQPGP
jgi:hypothetical protein